MLLYFNASYAGRIAPPGYPNTVVTPCCSRHSHSICAPVFIIKLSARNGFETHPKIIGRKSKPARQAGQSHGSAGHGYARDYTRESFLRPRTTTMSSVLTIYP